MRFYHDTLEKAAKSTGFNYKLIQSGKSEASYLEIWDGTKRDESFPLTVRMAGHEAMCVRSKSEIEIDGCMILDWDTDYFQSEWSIDEDGNVTMCEDEIEFDTAVEMSNYMANIVVKSIVNALN